MVDWDAMLANVTLHDIDDAPKITCEDCIHHKVCGYHITDETDLTVEECTHFKNKADFAEVKHGRWIRYKENCLYNRCSRCLYEHCREPNYCPNCGAKMDGDTE